MHGWALLITNVIGKSRLGNELVRPSGSPAAAGPIGIGRSADVRNILKTSVIHANRLWVLSAIVSSAAKKLWGARLSSIAAQSHTPKLLDLLRRVDALLRQQIPVRPQPVQHALDVGV